MYEYALNIITKVLVRRTQSIAMLFSKKKKKILFSAKLCLTKFSKKKSLYIYF